MTTQWRAAYPVASPECSAIPSLAFQAPFDLALAEIAHAGYEGVELQVRDASDAHVQRVGDACAAAGLQIAALGTGPVAAEDALSLSADEESVRVAALRRLGDIVDLAGSLGVPVTLGSARGDVGPEAAGRRAWARDAVLTLAARADSFGGWLLLEPQSTGAFIRTTADAVELFGPSTAWPPGLGLVLDLWHADQAGEGHQAAWDTGGDRIRHLQVAGPHRGPVVAEARLLSSLEPISGAGSIPWVTAEHRQVPDSAAAAHRSLAALDWARWRVQRDG